MTHDTRSPSHPLPVLFCLHHLGGSGREWQALSRGLDGLFTCVPLDLPGFGDAVQEAGYSVAEMAEVVAAAIRERRPVQWALAGHSMGAKVALAVARRAEDGDPGLAGLFHLVLVAGSPPHPEPMDESRRATMLGWFKGDSARSHAEAEQFVAANVGAPLDASDHGQAVDDVLRSHPAAWAAWLERGSREDLREDIGHLRTPALIVAGGADGDLGPAAQRRHMAPHFASSHTAVIDAAGHLMPYERPEHLAALVIAHVLCPDSPVPRAFWELVASDRVSARTRAALVKRGQADDPAYRPTMLTDAQFATLRAVVAQLVPQSAPAIDLAARIDASLAEGKGDGWRPVPLPADAACYRQALSTLDGMARQRFGSRFADLGHGRQDGILKAAASGAADPSDAPDHPLAPELMKLWSEELRADAVRHYVCHPATMARMGYDGFAYGGDGERLQGFVQIGPDERDAWEPKGAIA